MVDGAWARRNAYAFVAPKWWLVTDRSGSVVESLRGLRVGAVTDVPGWGCLVGVYRGLRVGIIAVTDDGRLLPVTPEHDEASWSVTAACSSGTVSLSRTDLDGIRSAGTWTPADELTLAPPVPPAARLGQPIKRV